MSVDSEDATGARLNQIKHKVGDLIDDDPATQVAEIRGLFSWMIRTLEHQVNTLDIIDDRLRQLEQSIRKGSNQ